MAKKRVDKTNIKKVIDNMNYCLAHKSDEYFDNIVTKSLLKEDIVLIIRHLNIDAKKNNTTEELLRLLRKGLKDYD